MMEGVGYFAVIIILLIPTTGCNGTLLYLLLCRNNLNTIPNKYIASVLKSHLLSGLFVGVITVVIILSEYVSRNALFCFMTNFTDRSLLAASTFSMVGLSIDRCRFYCGEQSTINQVIVKTKRALAIIWIAAFGYGLMCLILGFSIIAFDRVHGICQVEHDNRIIGTGIFLLDFLALVILPAVLMTIHYYRTVKKLWFMPYACLAQQRIKRKSTIMNMTISVTNMLLSAPFCGFKIVFIVFQSEIDIETENKYVQFASLLLTCVRCLTVPVIYLCLSEQTKNELRVNRSNIVAQEPKERRITLDIDKDHYVTRRGSIFQIENKSSSGFQE